MARKVRMDFGKEAAIIVFVQRHYELEVLTGPSVHNIKAETIWGHLRKTLAEWWRKILSWLAENGWDSEDDKQNCLMLHILLGRIQSISEVLAQCPPFPEILRSESQIHPLVMARFRVARIKCQC